MSRVHNKKIANKYADELHDVMFGDEDDDLEILGESADTASKVLDALSLAAKGGGEIASKVAADKKAAADAKAQQAKMETAQKARDAANDAAADAEIAERKAAAEQNPNGPLHIAALQARQKANKLDAVARQAEGQAGMSMMPSNTGGAMSPSKMGSSRPWYFWPAIIGGVAVGGAILYRVVGGGSSGGSRYMRAR